MRFLSVIASTLTCLSGFVTAAEPLPQTPPTPASKTAKGFHLPDGFRMTLLAAEPMVTDPVALCYDADGRAYVAEMNDYPYTDKAHHKPMQENPTDEAIGKIRLLEDTDSDGRFDKATVFADGLSWPTGVTPWKGGVYVTAAPDLWYFKDTDGDGKADVKEKVLTGFRKYNVQAEVNNPIWGLDHHIYIASASNRGNIYSPSAGPDSAVDVGRHDVRIDPANGNSFELISGSIQFGNSFDDWGNRFIGGNSNPVYHVVMPAEAFERNPWLPSRGALQLCTDPEAPIQLYPQTEIEGWRLQRYKDRTHVPRKGYKPPRGETPGDPSSPTSSSGPVVYRGDAYPEEYRGSIFIPEPCYNLIYHLDRKPKGATFTVTKASPVEKADMVDSTDVWFRPTNFVNAPDGCLHVADLYREAIEHPWSLPEEFHARMDLERGRDRGRIYRLEPPGFRPRRAPKLSEASSKELVSLLGHPNAWHRDTAHRLLFERQDSSVVPELHELAHEGKKPLGRLHALWTLKGLGALTTDDLEAAIHDPAPGVRANAATLAGQSGRPALLVTLASDPDPAVRFHTALALSSAATDPTTGRALAEIARQDVGDPWTRLAVLSSSVPHASAMLNELLADDSFATSGSSGEFLGSLARTLGAKGDAGESAALLNRLAGRGRPDLLTLQIVSGLTTGLRSSKSSLAEVAHQTDSGETFLDTLFDAASGWAADSGLPVSQRTAAIAMLRNAPYDETSQLLRNFLVATEPEEIQSAACSAISAAGGQRPEVGAHLLEGWDSYSGQLRAEVVQLLLARTERLDALFDAIESRKVQPYQIDTTRQTTLMANSDSKIAARAERLFAGAGSRKAVLERYRSVTELTGDPAKGETTYQGICMACHKFYDQGFADLAPNLAVVADWETERILTNILDPNREVAPDYMSYIVETKSGSTFTGRVVAESTSGITLQSPDNSTHDIARSDIAILQNSGRSLMPDGLEAAIPPQAMSDLISFLQASPKPSTQ